MNVRNPFRSSTSSAESRILLLQTGLSTANARLSALVDETGHRIAADAREAAEAAIAGSMPRIETHIRREIHPLMMKVLQLEAAVDRMAAREQTLRRVMAHQTQETGRQAQELDHLKALVCACFARLGPRAPVEDTLSPAEEESDNSIYALLPLDQDGALDPPNTDVRAR